MSMRDYFEISPEEVVDIGDESILIVIENTSLSKYKNISVETDHSLEDSSENPNDSFTISSDSYAQVCLQPFVINCDGVPPTSGLFVYDTTGTYKITLNGVVTEVRGSDLKDFFSRNKISMTEIVEPS